MLVLRYLVQGLRSSWLLTRRRPPVVLLMLPPAVALLFVLPVAVARRIRLVVDLHTGFFTDPKWSWATAASLRLLRGRTAIVTNAALARRCERSGVHAVVLNDHIRDRRRNEHRPSLTSQEVVVTVPLSYANDEPLTELLEAARALSSYRFMLTGSAPEWIRAAAPANVTFTGRVDDDAYAHLIAGSTVVCALTTRPDTMQRAGYEALMYGVPQVTSDHEVLRNYYGSAAACVPPTAEGLAAGISDVVTHHERFVAATAALLDEKISEQESSLAELQQSLRP